MKKLAIELADNGGFTVEIPSQTVEGVHHVRIPFTITGLGVLRKLLQERLRKERQTIGMNGSPTQQQVEAWLAKEKLVTTEEIEQKRRAKEEKELAAARKNSRSANIVAAKNPLLTNLNIEELDL